MRTLQHKRPLWLGLLLGSIAPPVCFLAGMLISFRSAEYPPPLLATSFIILIVAFPYSFIAVFGLGLPYVLWLRSRNYLNVLTVIVGAVILGSIGFVIFVLAPDWRYKAADLSEAWFGPLFGLVAGIAFCIGTGPSNPFKANPLRG